MNFIRFNAQFETWSQKPPTTVVHVHVVLLLGEEILHQLIGSYPIICKVLYIPGGAGFLPSTVAHKWIDNSVNKGCISSQTQLLLPFIRQLSSSTPGVKRHVVAKSHLKSSPGFVMDSGAHPVAQKWQIRWW